MSYTRVIPRDLFNEANLLKCYGRLYIVTEGNRDAHFPDDDCDSFDIVQRDEDGYLYIENLPFEIHGKQYRLVRPLNSRGAWPLYAEDLDDSDADAIPVFDPDGNLSDEMDALIRKGIK